ncbi:DUF2442 domain-containing protein [uncultured Hymenobacter sp.]
MMNTPIYSRFPRLHAARPEQRRVEIGGGGRGLHWDELEY